MNGPQQVEVLQPRELARRAMQAAVAVDRAWLANEPERAEDWGTTEALCCLHCGSSQERREEQPESSRPHPWSWTRGAAEASGPTARDSGGAAADHSSHDGCAGEAIVPNQGEGEGEAAWHAAEVAAGGVPQENVRQAAGQVAVLWRSESAPQAALARVSSHRPWWTKIGERREERTARSARRSRSRSRRRSCAAKPERRRLDPCVLARIASCSRRREGERSQQARREREDALREHVASFSEAAHRQGLAYEQVAEELNVPVRTLSYWRELLRDPQRVFRPARGRPRRESSPQTRRRVLDLLDRTGPRIGVPMLRRVFPQMARRELAELERDYRLEWRRAHPVLQAVLHWSEPGRVWAMDYSRPPELIEGRYCSIFSVRDLASGLQLAWVAVEDESAVTTCRMLVLLFLEYGVPLVLKSDNGSGFISSLVQELLAQQGVAPLLSPPGTPRYNGSCEAGIGAMKVRTQDQAAWEGRARRWTSADLEAARRHANEFYVRDEHSGRTAQELWNSASPIKDAERERLHETIQRLESELRAADSSAGRAPADQREEAARRRSVVCRALQELGLLSINRRPIALPLKRRKLAKIL